jgi:hypothetical protein
MATAAAVPTVTIRVRGVVLFFIIRRLMVGRWRWETRGSRSIFPDHPNPKSLHVYEEHDGVRELDWCPAANRHADGAILNGQRSIIHRKGSAQFPGSHQETVAVTEGWWNAEELDLDFHQLLRSRWVRRVRHDQRMTLARW